MINQAMYQRNGRCGYVLKPEALRPGGESLLEKKTRYTFEVKAWHSTYVLAKLPAHQINTLDRIGTATPPSKKQLWTRGRRKISD